MSFELAKPSILVRGVLVEKNGSQQQADQKNSNEEGAYAGHRSIVALPAASAVARDTPFGLTESAGAEREIANTGSARTLRLTLLRHRWTGKCSRHTACFSIHQALLGLLRSADCAPSIPSWHARLREDAPRVGSLKCSSRLIEHSRTKVFSLPPPRETKANFRPLGRESLRGQTSRSPAGARRPPDPVAPYRSRVHLRGRP